MAPAWVLWAATSTVAVLGNLMLGELGEGGYKTRNAQLMACADICLLQSPKLSHSGNLESKTYSCESFQVWFRV